MIVCSHPKLLLGLSICIWRKVIHFDCYFSLWSISTTPVCWQITTAQYSRTLHVQKLGFLISAKLFFSNFIYHIWVLIVYQCRRCSFVWIPLSMFLQLFVFFIGYYCLFHNRLLVACVMAVTLSLYYIYCNSHASHRL